MRDVDRHSGYQGTTVTSITQGNSHWLYSISCLGIRCVVINWLPPRSGGFKSQQCQQLLTGLPLNIVLRAPSKKKKRGILEKLRKQLGQRGQWHNNRWGWQKAQGPPPLFFFFFFFLLFTFWNHWKLFWVHQNEHFFLEKSISHWEKMPMKGPHRKLLTGSTAPTVPPQLLRY